jgi:hypothetical protein
VETQGGAPAGSVQQVLKWDNAGQTFETWSHEYGFGDNFATQPGDFILLMLSPAAPASVTFSGAQPAPGAVSFDLLAGQPSPDCTLNFISLPFDQSALSTADLLSDDIGGVLQALDWDATNQSFVTWSNEHGFGDNFPTSAGYPYLVCLDHTGPAQWP